jgi:hypothetical protein
MAGSFSRKADARDCTSLLRARRERPRSRSAEQRYEQRLRYGEAQNSGRLGVDDELDLGLLFAHYNSGMGELSWQFNVRVPRPQPL